MIILDTATALAEALKTHGKAAGTHNVVIQIGVEGKQEVTRITVPGMVAEAAATAIDLKHCIMMQALGKLDADEGEKAGATS